MKNILISSLLALFIVGCSDDKKSENIVGSWCITEDIDIFKLTFSDNKIFKTEVLIFEALDHGTWTVRDDQLLTKINVEGEVQELTYDLRISGNDLYLKKVEDESSDYNPLFNYLSIFGDNEEGIALARCSE